MTIGTNLLDTIPMPTAKPMPQNTVVASVKVGDIDDSGSNKPIYKEPERGGFFNKIRNILVEYRMKKIAAKAPDLRTPVEQAEYEANQKNINCVV